MKKRHRRHHKTSFIEKIKKFEYLKETLAILIIVVGFIAIYQTFIPKTCGDFGCFREQMETCSPATLVNENPEASWGYEIRGIRNNNCIVEVSLLNAKEGELGLKNYEGTSMFCIFERGVVGYPERNLDNCHGMLKEGIQDLAIDKLYGYVVQNLEDIRDGLFFS